MELNNLLKGKKTKRKCYLPQNIKYLLGKHNLDFSDLSEETGIPASTLTKMKRNDPNPTIATIEPVASFFRLDVSDILYENLKESFYDKSKHGKFHPIPLVDLDETLEWTKDKKSKITTIIETVGINNDSHFGVTLPDDSLAPVFRRGTVLIIDTKAILKDYAYVLCTLEDNTQPVFRQLILDGNDYYFRVVNEEFGNSKSYKKFNVIGVITKSIMSF